MVDSLALEDELERQLEARGLDGDLDALPARPVLAVYVCLACGERVVASTVREWASTGP